METIITVAALNRYIASRFREDRILREIMIKGEISNFTRHYKSGHFYFTLKDSEAAVKAVMWASSAADLSFVPENGMSVIVTGSIQVFERDGVYQINCTDIVPDGIGRLFARYDQLKNKLSSEGLFDEQRKKALPRFPCRIGIVTAKGAAALQDMLTILSRRAPYMTVTLYETAVQGENAAASIAEQIKFADSKKEDLLIVGRGGGSFEDLFPFSDEAVVRAVANTKTPIITAVGHETDTPLCDFAADLRAPTPSAAAELAVCDLSEILSISDSYKNSAYSLLSDTVERCETKLSARYTKLAALLPAAKLQKMSDTLKAKRSKLNDIIEKSYEKYLHAYELRLSAIEKLSPLALLSRGYAIAQKNDRVITSAAALVSNDLISITFSDGKKEARIV
jgi:exodeoxyribonuclease VII large subunit